MKANLEPIIIRTRSVGEEGERAIKSHKNGQPTKATAIHQFAAASISAIVFLRPFKECLRTLLVHHSVSLSHLE